MNDEPYEVGVAVGVHPAAYVRAELSITENAAEHLHHHREPVAFVAAWETTYKLGDASMGSAVGTQLRNIRSTKVVESNQ